MKYERDNPQTKEGIAHRESIKILELELLIIGMAIILNINWPKPCQATIAILPTPQNFLSILIQGNLTLKTVLGIE